MKRIAFACLLLLGLLLPLRPIVAQEYPPFPELDALREWLWKNHPNVITGDSGVNAAIVVIDTNAHVVKGMSFRLDERELARWQGAVSRVVSYEGDTVSKRLASACVDRAEASAKVARPVCVLDSVRVHAVDNLTFLAARDVEVYKGEAATSRFGPEAAHGAVVILSDDAALERFKSLGATPATLISFQGRRIRRRADGETTVITVLMLRGTSR